MPFGPGHRRVEEGVGLELEALGDRLEVVPDLLAEGVTPGRDVVELLEHREVHVRLDVAHHARVPVPVPGSADATRLIDDADPLETGLAELGPGQDTGDPPTDDHDVNLVHDGVALDDRCERVITVVGEMLVGPQVADFGPTGDQAPVALGEVLGPDRLGVEDGGSLGCRRRFLSEGGRRRWTGPGHGPKLLSQLASV